ncbi:Holliday junction branch migration protein RuvA [Formicincola oecophyllae]|uniref:Holliday junction branch migration complex subunit RuvA n=1 Tax=Formicincola oecophyllae TaxID=2558361 RepID=A0A4Y6UBC9_9PROT|nr:Holliday junction branch migration protein RuvA [Formicincola oecophyllae]QDH13776.1 Holliday junction branch migration protein RuvA [Formicincola oecophyllae]
MIGRLTGLVEEAGEHGCLIDVNGVGYNVMASSRTLAALSRPPKVARVLTEMVVREDAMQLYGFATAEERSLFRLLTTVQGVGARVALAILSLAPPSELAMAIAAGDKAMFTRAAGVGPKLAGRLVSELAGKVPDMPMAQSGVKVPSGAGGAGLLEDLTGALLSLGYTRSEAWPVASRVIGANPGAGLNQLVPLALRAMSTP